MAQSNYDQLAIDVSGKKVECATYVSPAGVGVQIYKNWVYVLDENAWRNDSQFVRPVVMQVNQGLLVYRDTTIFVMRGPLEGAYVGAYNYKYPRRGDPRLTGMIGIGVYDKVLPEHVEWFARELYRLRRGRPERFVYDDLPDVFRALVLNLGDYIGRDHPPRKKVCLSGSHTKKRHS